MIQNDQDLRKKLNQLITDYDFLEIQESFEKESLFQLLGFGHRETMHSSFIAWLLSPTSSLNLGTYPLKRFFYYISENNLSGTETPINLQLIESDTLQLEDIKIATEEIGTIIDSKTNKELKVRFDLVLTNEVLRLVLENKVLSIENKDQTENYTKVLNELDSSSYEYDLKVFLSPDVSQKPKCSEFIQINYQGLYEMVILPCLNHPKITTANTNILKEYVHNLRIVYKGVNKPMAKINDELCITIYKKYKDVLDEIFDAVKGETPQKRKLSSNRSNLSWENLYLNLSEEEKNLESNYGGEITKAEIDLTDGEIIFNGERYSSPSAASVAAINFVKGEGHTDRNNGYLHWSIVYPDGTKKKLADVRQELSLTLV